MTLELYRKEPGGELLTGLPDDRNRWPVLVAGCGRTGTSLMISLIETLDDFIAPFEETFTFAELQMVGDLSRGYQIIKDKLIDRWLYPQFKKNPQAVRWAEKSPNHVMFAEEIYSHLKGRVMFVFMIRDGRNVITSTIPSLEGAVQEAAFLRTKQVYLVFNWMALNLNKIYPENTMLVQYENLTNPETTDKTLSNVFDFIESNPQESFWDDWKKGDFTNAFDNRMQDRHIKRDKVAADHERWKQHPEIVKRFLSDLDVKQLQIKLGYSYEF